MLEIKGLDRYSEKDVRRMLGGEEEGAVIRNAENNIACFDWFTSSDDWRPRVMAFMLAAALSPEEALLGSLQTGMMMGYMLREQLLADERAEALLKEE